MSGIDPQYILGKPVPTQASEAPPAPNASPDPAQLGPAGTALGQADYPMGPIVALPSQMNAANRWGAPGPAMPAVTTPPAIDVIGQGAHTPFTGKE
jgi:hypothetical protein